MRVIAAFVEARTIQNPSTAVPALADEISEQRGKSFADDGHVGDFMTLAGSATRASQVR
jgi:hypothetical protein